MQIHGYKTIKVYGYSLFVFGYLFYTLVPVIYLEVFPDSFVGATVTNLYGFDNIRAYSLFAFTYLLVFSISFYTSGRVGRIRALPLNSSKEGNILYMVVSSGYLVIALIIVRPSEIINLSGYRDGYDVIHRGQLGTLFLTSVWWFIYFKNSFFKKLMLLIAVAAAFNLLSLGGRLHVVSGIVSIVVYKLCFSVARGVYIRRKIKIISGLFFALLLAVSFASIGVFRDGEGTIDSESFTQALFAEPVFIFASVLAYFSTQDLQLISLPKDVIVGAVGSVPSALFPLKLDLINEFNAIPVDAQSLFGGVNHIVALLANFGVLGFACGAFLEGFWFGFLTKLSVKNGFYRALFCCSIGVVPFILFRDGFQTSIKLLFFNFLIFPYLLLKVCDLIHYGAQGRGVST